MDTWSIILSIPFAITLISSLILFLIFVVKWKPHVADADMPSVSVFVPFYNEDSDLIIKSLNKIDDQIYPEKIQVIIIDDGSTNNAPAAVQRWLTYERKHEYVFVQREKNGGRKGIALDYVLEKDIARGDVYIVVDSDTFIEKDGVYELASKMWSDPRYAAVCGYIVPENYQGSLIGRSQYYEHIGVYGAFRAAQDQLGIVPVLAGAFVAHRAEVVKELGGWSEWLVEDISWCWKAIANNYRTGYAASAMATTQCPINRKDLFKQRRRWARGRVEAYLETWKVSKKMGFLSSPWFLMNALQYCIPPMIIAVPLMIYFSLWLPLSIIGINLIVDIIFMSIFIRKSGNRAKINIRDVLNIPFFFSLLEVITWLPNILGYVDELSGKDKSWLTR